MQSRACAFWKSAREPAGTATRSRGAASAWTQSSWPSITSSFSGGIPPQASRQGDARDLSAFADETYDVTLLLGPMYHLFTRGDQSAALSEAVRVTKRGGVVFAAYCMCDAAILQYGFVRGNVLRCIEQGMLDPESFETHSEPKDVFELYRREDIDLLRGALPVTQLHFVASDGFTNHIRETVDAMDDAVYAVWLRYCLATCERQDMVGCSHHTIDIFRKNT